MPLPTSINDLSTAQPSNSPAGTENPQTFDDYLRWHAAFIASLRDVVLSGTGNLSTANITYSGTLTGSTGILSIGSGQIYKDASGLIGLGTTTPTSRVDISDSNSRVVDLNTTSASGVGIRFRNSGVVNGYVGSAKYTVASGLLADFSIDAAGANNLVLGTNDIERMRVDSSGNVGIGITAPGAKLHVAGTFRQTDATNSTGYTVNTAAAKTITAAVSGGGSFSWQVNNSAVDAFTLGSAGNVTIAAPSSGNALTVNGGLRVDAATTSTAPTGGAAGALPALPVGYVTINIGGTDRKIAYYA